MSYRVASLHTLGGGIVLLLEGDRPTEFADRYQYRVIYCGRRGLVSSTCRDFVNLIDAALRYAEIVREHSSLGAAGRESDQREREQPGDAIDRDRQGASDARRNIERSGTNANTRDSAGAAHEESPFFVRKQIEVVFCHNCASLLVYERENPPRCRCGLAMISAPYLLEVVAR